MTYQELMSEGKMIFGFHPDEPFTSAEHIMGVAKSKAHRRDAYNTGASLFAESLARYVDESVESEEEGS